MLAQGDGLRAVEFARRLTLNEVGSLRAWVARLLDLGLVEQMGRTTATRYFVPPAILASAGLERPTTLVRVQPHRLRALILEDVERFPGSGMRDIQRRIGSEIDDKELSRPIAQLVAVGVLTRAGSRRWAVYTAASLEDSLP